MGKVTPRTWQRWEDGTRAIPDDIDTEVYSLIGMRNELISEFTQWQFANEGKLLQMRYYHSFEDYEADHPGENRATWRIHQAAVSFVFS
ncbi:hypothetical protein DF186_17110, partial [Enterococcus hirae]